MVYGAIFIYKWGELKPLARSCVIISGYKYFYNVWSNNLKKQREVEKENKDQLSWYPCAVNFISKMVTEIMNQVKS